MSYSTLGSYNSYGAGSCQSIRAPTSAMAVQVVPVFSPPGYDTLTRGGSCSGKHLEIMQAYSPVCDKFASRLCDCNLPHSGAQPPCAGNCSR